MQLNDTFFGARRSVKSTCQAHGHEFLEEQFCRVGNVDFADTSAALARSTLECVTLEIGDGRQSAIVANVNLISVGGIIHAFLEEGTYAVRDHTVALHLSETQTAVTRSTLNRLTCKNLHWSASSRVDLVVDHMLQALIVRRAKVNLGLKLATGVAIVHDFQSTALVAQKTKLLTDSLDGKISERGCVAFLT